MFDSEASLDHNHSDSNLKYSSSNGYGTTLEVVSTLAKKAHLISYAIHFSHHYSVHIKVPL